jgi:hypothetical protein
MKLDAQILLKCKDSLEKWPVTLIYQDVHIYRVSVFLRIGDEILVTWVVVPSIEAALETLKRYERDQNFLMASVEKM